MESGSHYIRLHVRNLPRAFEDEFTQICFGLGASGVAEDLKFVQNDLRYDPSVVETSTLDVNVFFTETAYDAAMQVVHELKYLQKSRAELSGILIDLVNEENKDWLAEWKKGFKPFAFAGPFWVIPSWCEPPAEASCDQSKLIYVEPGMAFGTGTHETTRLAGQILVDELGRARAQSLLDVGTGTGILALIADRLGVSEVHGTDIDPEARRTARENLRRNGADEIDILEIQLPEVTRTYEVIVANIIDGVLLSLRDQLYRVLRPGGRMILSGVLVDREQQFYEDFPRGTDLKILKKSRDGEWSAALLEKGL